MLLLFPLHSPGKHCSLIPFRVLYALQTLPVLKGVKQEQMEQILDRFEAREELSRGHVVIEQGQIVSGGVPDRAEQCSGQSMQGRC